VRSKSALDFRTARSALLPIMATGWGCAPALNIAAVRAGDFVHSFKRAVSVIEMAESEANQIGHAWMHGT
jgi:hypothetical protein